MGRVVSTRSSTMRRMAVIGAARSIPTTPHSTVAYSHLDQAGQCHHADDRPQTVKLKDGDRNREESSNDRTDRRDEVEEEGEDPEYNRKIEPKQTQDDADQDSRYGRGTHLQHDIATYRSVDLRRHLRPLSWVTPTAQEVDEEDQDERSRSDEPKHSTRNAPHEARKRQALNRFRRRYPGGVDPEPRKEREAPFGPPRQAILINVRRRQQPLGGCRDEDPKEGEQSHRHQEGAEHSQRARHPEPVLEQLDQRGQEIGQENGQHKGDHDRPSVGQGGGNGCRGENDQRNGGEPRLLGR